VKVIVQGRQSGKTDQLAAWTKEDPSRIMLVHSQREAARVRRTYDLPASQVVAVDSLDAMRLRGLGRPQVVIDNLDLVLPILLAGHLEAVLYFLLGEPVKEATATLPHCSISLVT